MTDEITLTFPPEQDFHTVAHLVVGGLAVRLDLTYDVLEDIKIALDELLARAGDDADVTVSVRVEGDVLRTTIGPFDDALSRELDDESHADGIGLRRLLETVADGVEVNGNHVELVKTVRTRSAA